MIDTAPSRTTGTFHQEETKYHVYFGPASPRDRNLKTFYDEDAANEFFALKQKAGLHVDVYSEVCKMTKTIKKLT